VGSNPSSGTNIEGTMPKLNVIQEKNNELPKDVLAKAIDDISSSVNGLLISGLNHKAVVALVHDDSGISKKTIKMVIDSLGSLKETYTHD
jgi:hypothetical protein